MNDKPVDDLTFEQALAELETIVTELEQEAIDLDHSIRLYERGQALAQRCNMLLEQATLRVRRLNDDEMAQLNA
ncbi:MAG: exodeoxyribonuclease VII small subunit [Anaerolineae bacterium]|nr:exodeoxyribonuclease VII small subunit [Anaerolineae bacterium]